MDENTESDILEASGDVFFECLEKQLKTSIPVYVKNILKMNGFYNAFMMSKLVDAKISEIELFMRNDFAQFMLPEGEKIDDYLGVYIQCQDKFKFLCGHKTLLEIMGDACRAYYPSISASTTTTPVNGNIDESTKDEIFQKLSDGVTKWLISQKKYGQVLQFELNFIISCETETTTSDDVSYTVTCPVPWCRVEKSFSVIWKSYARSIKNKNSDAAPKFCQPRWFFCSLMNHFQKCHLDTLNEVLEIETETTQDHPLSSSSASTELMDEVRSQATDAVAKTQTNNSNPSTAAMDEARSRATDVATTFQTNNMNASNAAMDEARSHATDVTTKMQTNHMNASNAAMDEVRSPATDVDNTDATNAAMDEVRSHATDVMLKIPTNTDKADRVNVLNPGRVRKIPNGTIKSASYAGRAKRVRISKF